MVDRLTRDSPLGARRILFRVDASERIGTGHVMRCLALAADLQGRGAEIVFLSRKLQGDLIGQVREQGFPVWELAPPDSKMGSAAVGEYVDWLEVTAEEDAAQTLNVIQARAGRVDGLVVDHYALGAAWERKLRPVVGRILVIDDLGNRGHDCDILVDHNYVSRPSGKYAGKVPAGCLLLQGPSYSLLRTEFRRAHVHAVRMRRRIERLFVFFGGVDSTGETLKALQALQAIASSHVLPVDIVVGSRNPRRDEVVQAASKVPGARLLSGVNRMADLMASADLSVGAGGTATWERCCLGLPSLVVTVAENQREAIRDLAREGHVRLLGSHDEVSVDDLARALREAIEDAPGTIAMGERSRALVDGLGVQRVADEYCRAIGLENPTGPKYT